MTSQQYVVGAEGIEGKEMKRSTDSLEDHVEKDELDDDEEEEDDENLAASEAPAPADECHREDDSVSDDFEKKRRKRLELNRKAAQESRARKKARIEELQRNVVLLSRENAELREQNSLLRQMLGNDEEEEENEQHHDEPILPESTHDQDDNERLTYTAPSNFQESSPEPETTTSSLRLPDTISNFLPASLTSDVIQAMAAARFPPQFVAAAAAAAAAASSDPSNEMQQQTAASLMTMASLATSQPLTTDTSESNAHQNFNHPHHFNDEAPPIAATIKTEDKQASSSPPHNDAADLSATHEKMQSESLPADLRGDAPLTAADSLTD